jgi:hypothetical protein
MLRTITAALFALFLTAPASGQDLCEAETDEFTGDTTVQCEYDRLPVEEHPQHYLDWSRVAVLTANDTYILAFGTKSESWNFLNTDTAYALIDGERYEWNLYEIRTEADGPGVREVHGIAINASDLAAVAEASRIRVKFGGAVFNLTPTTVQEQAQETENLTSSGI